MTGRTDTGSGFPGTSSSLIQNASGGGTGNLNTLDFFVDAFVTKINATGTAIVYSTYLGGSGDDFGSGIAVDTAGNAYVTGLTNSPGTNFPGTAGSLIQSTYAGGAIAGARDAFVSKLNAAGTAIVYSTYLGGSGDDVGTGIAVDQSGQVYVTGNTDTPGSGFPGTASSPIQSAQGGQADAFVAKINARGTALMFSTYLGGSGDDGSGGIAVDRVGNAYVTGSTNTPDSGFPGTASSLIQSTLGGGYPGIEDAFVAKITSTVPFARFRPVSNIDLRPVQGKDWFDAFASFTLGIDSDGIAPLTEPVTIQIGTFFTTIPARAFKLKDGDFVFKGSIDGVKLYARFHHIKGRNYEFWTYANCATLTGTRNPVRVGLMIGDDSGSATITAKFGRTN